MKKCAVKITNWLIRSNAVPKSDQELYEYALYSIFMTLSPLLLAIAIGVFFKAVVRSILIILPFVVIRKYSGGFHTKKPEACFIVSSLLLVLCMMLSFHIQCGWLVMCFTVGAIVSLAYFSPIDNENRLLSEEEQRCCKKQTVIISSIFLTVVVLLHFFRFHIYEVNISVGIILSAGLQFPVVIRGIDHKNSPINQKR